MKKEFHHIGVPTTVPQAGETYLAEAKLFVTDANQSPHRIELLRFEPGSPMHELLKTTAHVAYAVDDLKAALVGQEVIVPPFVPMPGLQVAFIREGNVPVEYLEFAK